MHGVHSSKSMFDDNNNSSTAKAITCGSPLQLECLARAFISLADSIQNSVAELTSSAKMSMRVNPAITWLLRLSINVRAVGQSDNTAGMET